MKKYKVYALGAALVDTEIKVEDHELRIMGVEKGLMTLVDQSRQTELLDHLQGHLVKASHASGGSAANTVIATAQFGGPTYFSCKVAQDTDGDLYLADLESAGVDHNHKGLRDDGITGKCLVLITPDAERSMNSFLGISETLSVNELDPAAIAASEYLYIEGYLVTSDSGRAAAIRAREIAETEGVKTALSLSDPGMVEFFREGLQQMAGERLDLLFANEAEALGWGETDNLDIAIERLKQVADAFTITRGAQGALTWDGDELTEIPPHQVHAVDTNGAGDMFAGAFLYAITAGENFATAGKFASLAAGTVVAQYGPRLPAEAHHGLKSEFFG